MKKIFMLLLTMFLGCLAYVLCTMERGDPSANPFIFIMILSSWVMVPVMCSIDNETEEER